MQTPRITLKPGYADSKGVVHATLREAQIAELHLLFDKSAFATNGDVTGSILDNADAIMAILTASPDGEGMPIAEPPKVAKRRLSLTTVLNRCRHAAYTDDQIAAKVADGTITKVPKIGDASVALLKEWAAAYRPAPAPPEVATAAFGQMRETVNEAVNA